MSGSEELKIYFHVGLGKTATTYLQYDVFPKLKGLYYIQRTSYTKSPEIIRRGKYRKYLVSREFDQQFDREVEWFSAFYPQSTPIIVFRRQDSWIASQYRRFVKNGFRGSFQQFIDLDQDQGHFKMADLQYFPKIRKLEACFDTKPIVLFYKDLMDNPNQFIQNLANRLGATFQPEDINLDRRHTSYDEKQLKTIRAVGRVLNLRKRRTFENEVLNTFGRIYLSALRYPILYIGKLLPASWFDPKPLVDDLQLERIRQAYATDWENCIDYAKGQDLTKPKRKSKSK